MKIFQPRPNKSPKIYGYTELSPEYDGLIKIGYTEREVKDRMKVNTKRRYLFLKWYYFKNTYLQI